MQTKLICAKQHQFHTTKAFLHSKDTDKHLLPNPFFIVESAPDKGAALRGILQTQRLAKEPINRTSLLSRAIHVSRASRVLNELQTPSRNWHMSSDLAIYRIYLLCL
eukprot:5164987-Amphidinium_carterae.1